MYRHMCVFTEYYRYIQKFSLEKNRKLGCLKIKSLCNVVMADLLLVLTCKLLCLFCALGGVYQRSNENNSEDGEENYQTGPC